MTTPFMLPLQDWLVLEAAQAAEKIPYLTVVGASGEIGRVVPSRHVLAATLEVDGRWRSLQESGGIRNSFALRALAEEQIGRASCRERGLVTV